MRALTWYTRYFSYTSNKIFIVSCDNVDSVFLNSVYNAVTVTGVSYSSYSTDMSFQI